MSDILFQATSFVTGHTELPLVSNIRDIVYVERFEEDSYEHWMYRGNTPTVGRVNGRALTVQSGATVQPVFTDSYVSLSSTVGNALVTALLDSSVTAFTMSGLIMPETTTLAMMLGLLGATAAAPVAGFGVFVSAGAAYLTSRTSVDSLNVGAALVAGKPLFASVSIDKTTKAVKFLVQQGGVFYSKEVAGHTYIDAALPISVGNYRYGSVANTAKQRHYETIVHTRALTLSEMQGVAERMRTRQATYGVDY